MFGLLFLKLSKALALVVMLATLTSACFIRPSEEAKLARWEWGRNLAIRVLEMDRKDQMAYIKDGQHFILKPASQEAVLQAVKVEIYQNGSAALFLTPNSSKVSLGYGKDKSSTPIPLDRGISASQEAALPYLKTPLFDERVTLPKDNVISGWLLFEIPKDSIPSRLTWDDIDHVVVPLPAK